MRNFINKYIGKSTLNSKMMAAAKLGDIKTMKELTKAGADPFKVDWQCGRSPISYILSDSSKTRELLSVVANKTHDDD